MLEIKNGPVMLKLKKMPLRRLRATLLILFLFIFLAFSRSSLTPATLAQLQWAGGIIIGLSVLIRTLSSVYVAGYKNRQLITQGPYSLSRNPLYVAWLVGAFGMGLVVGSPILAIALAAAIFVIYTKAILLEEKRLSAQFPSTWQEYVANTPRWLGKSSNSNWQPASPARPKLVGYAFLEGSSMLVVYPLHQSFMVMQDAAILPVIFYYF